MHMLAGFTAGSEFHATLKNFLIVFFLLLLQFIWYVLELQDHIENLTIWNINDPEKQWPSEIYDPGNQ